MKAGGGRGLRTPRAPKSRDDSEDSEDSKMGGSCPHDVSFFCKTRRMNHST